MSGNGIHDPSLCCLEAELLVGLSTCLIALLKPPENPCDYICTVGVQADDHNNPILMCFDIGSR